MFVALINNPEINAISGDTDVEKFYGGLLTNHWEILSKDEYNAVTEYVEDPVPF